MPPRRSPRIMPTLDPEAVSRCVETVRIALMRANREEAIAAVNRAFGYQPAAVNVEFSTPIADLGLDVRTSNMLEEHGIKTAGALAATTPAELDKLPQAGPRFIERLREVMEKYKLTPRNAKAWKRNE